MTSVIPVDLSFLGGVTQYDIRAQLKLLCLSIQNRNFAFKKIGISDFQKSATMLIHHPFRDEINPSAVYIENRVTPPKKLRSTGITDVILTAHFYTVDWIIKSPFGQKIKSEVLPSKEIFREKKCYQFCVFIGRPIL